MPDGIAYGLGMAVIVIVLIAAMGIVRCIWWGAQLLRTKAEGQRLENQMMERDLADRPSKRAGFHG